MPWLVVDIALVAMSLAVLVAISWRLYRQSRQLGRDVARTAARLTSATTTLQGLLPLDPPKVGNATYDRVNSPTKEEIP